jgi:hypothetical protein
MDAERLDATFPAWMDAATAIYRSRGAEARTLAADFFKALRIAAGKGAPRVIVSPQPLDVRTFQTDMKIKVVIGVKDAMTAGRPLEQAMQAAFVNSTGRATKLVLDAGRQEVIDLGNVDKAVTRWSRVTSGGCDFCRMLADKGGVFYESTADFAAHDHCQCAAVPEFGDGSKAARDYTGATRSRTQADRDALREYLNANY